MEGVFFNYGVWSSHSGGYLERDFRLFKARGWSSDSARQDRVVPRNFTAGSGSNGCNNFPTLDRLPLHPPWLLL